MLDSVFYCNLELILEPFSKSVVAAECTTGNRGGSRVRNRTTDIENQVLLPFTVFNHRSVNKPLKKFIFNI